MLFLKTFKDAKVGLHLLPVYKLSLGTYRIRGYYLLNKALYCFQFLPVSLFDYTVICSFKRFSGRLLVMQNVCLDAQTDKCRRFLVLLLLFIVFFLK